MGERTVPPWDPQFRKVALVVLSLGFFIVLASGEARAFLAVLAGTVTLLLIALGEWTVSRFRGEPDE